MMNRRDSFTLIPLSLAGLAGLPARAFAQEDAGCRGSGQAPGEVRKQEPPLAIAYTLKVREMLRWIRHTQSENLLEAAYAIARTVKRGGTCWCSWDMGHNTLYDMFPDRNGNPGIFTMGYNADRAKKGDLFLASIYTNPLDDQLAKEIFIVAGPAPWSSDAKMAELIVRDSAKYRLRPYANIWIETNVSTLGAIMQVPGMPAPIGPVSGIIGMVTFWMMQADACRILARDNITRTVEGDEPELSGDNVPWISLDEPVMDDYFEVIMNQIEMIRAELGDIRKIGRMAVDSLLSGGKVYVYSRYRNSLSAEAQTRRGGLALTRGIHFSEGKITGPGGDFNGTEKDLVIMGLFKPDDEMDLKALDLFRKRKVKVASMGPLSRDIKVPEGRTVPKETDVHVGRMCDTYGLFAIPGFNRKVCPTSGALLNQIFWATCMEIVEETMRRTGGNVPGVFFSAAVKNGTEHMYRMNSWRDERGY